MIKKVFIAVAVLLACAVAGLLVTIALQPSTYHVERFTTISAPPSAVFAHVNDLHAWDSWSPWKDLDPNPKTSFSNPSAGKGASFSWNGNDQVGEGTLTILDSKADERIDVEQAFVRPLAGKANMAFTFKPEGAGTKVIWAMDGHNDFLGKAVCLVMNMDAMVGTSFEQGLSNMKALVEKEAAEPFSSSR
jgi:hypothetical protein